MPDLLTLGPVTVPAPDDGTVLRYDAQAVQDVVDFFSILCYGQNEWAGQPFQLLPWELDAITQFYGIQEQDEDGQWYRHRRFFYNELPKKNGKTELAAGLGLYHLLWDGEQRPKRFSGRWRRTGSRPSRDGEGGRPLGVAQHGGVVG